MSTESLDFFQPGRTYTRNLPFAAPEVCPSFQCVAVAEHPTRGTRRALGFERQGANAPWASSSLRDEEWADGWVEVTAPGESAQPAELTVYRASHDSIVMGLYTTATEARAHCVAEERRAWAKFSPPVFDWIEDDEDGVAELVTVTEDGETETETGYVVTPLTVASAYDEDGDE